MRSRGDHRMRVPIGVVASLGAALMVAVPVAARTAAAQTTQAPPMPVVALGMTLPEYQGWGCLAGGTTGATGVYVYSDAIAIAATGAINPVLLIPAMATGFAIGCTVGAAVSPAFLWIGRASGGH